MNYKKLIQKKLDSSLSSKEGKELEEILSRNEAARRELNEAQKLYESFSRKKTPEFSGAFQDNVMRRIRLSKTDENILSNELNKVFKRFAIAAAAIIILVTSYNFINRGEISFNALIGYEKVSLAYALDSSSILTIANDPEN